MSEDLDPRGGSNSNRPLDRGAVRLDGLRFDDRGLVPVVVQDVETN